MIRILFIAFLFAGITGLRAQVGYGPEGGVGMKSHMISACPGFTSASTSPIFSWRVGGLLDLGLNKNIYLQSGLFFSRRGQNRNFSFYKNDSENNAVQQTLNINYIDVPVNIVYKTGSQGMGRFFAGLGATPSYILGGTNKLQSQGKSGGVQFNNSFDLHIGQGNPLALFDLGVSLTAGYELPTGLFFRTYFTTGVQDIGLGGEVDKNRMWGISAGYIFGKGRNINKEADDLIDRTGN